VSTRRPCSSGLLAYSNADFYGTYAFQLTGSYVFPASNPLSSLNGPFAVNGTIWADGRGHLKKSFIANYNGQVMRVENAESAYEVNPDGTYTETFVVPFGKSTATITYDGVLIDFGKEARLMVSGFSLQGLSLPQGYIGMVIEGSMVRR
jgi:hypothetical protein